MILYQHWYDSRIYFSVFDIIFIIGATIGVILYSIAVQNKNSSKMPYYKNYTKALTLKIFAGITFALITMGFYPGDTFEYFMTAHSLNNILFTNPSHYFDIQLYGNLSEYWSYFNTDTGYPAWYIWKDPNSVMVARIYSPFMLLTNNSFISSTIIAALIGFSGLWKLYVLFCRIYPQNEKRFAIAILYFPSVLFWSSGILKDTLTISAIGWIMYCFYNFAILKKFKFKYAIMLFVGSIVIINIKSYIFAALLPGLLVWLFFEQLKAIKSGFMKFVVAPFMVIVIIIGFSFLMSRLSSSMGKYGDVNSALITAQITQQDLTRSEQYGENYYNIGEFEATPIGVLKKAPISIVSGIFRPFIWEARNPFILLAGLESLCLMFFLFYCIAKTSVAKFFRNIISEPLLIFSFSFVIIFGFGVGLATANFGALVRYKIPLLPFLMSALFILINKIKPDKKIIKGF